MRFIIYMVIRNLGLDSSPWKDGVECKEPRQMVELEGIP